MIGYSRAKGGRVTHIRERASMFSEPSEDALCGFTPRDGSGWWYAWWANERDMPSRRRLCPACQKARANNP